MTKACQILIAILLPSFRLGRNFQAQRSFRLVRRHRQDSPELSRELALQDAQPGSIGQAGHAFHGRPLDRRKLYADPLWSIDGQVSFADWTIGVLKTYSKPIIPKTRLTVASFLKSQGYHTACIGKWHLGMNWVDVKKASPRSFL